MRQHYLPRLLEARLVASRGHILLLGPRQVGKSTLCRHLRPNLIIELADETEYLSYSKDPSRIKRELAALRKPSLILIDEIQRVPALLNTLQLLIDSPNFKHRFVITGSSARKLRRGEVNLLPGRITLEYLDPLQYLEAGSDFNLEKGLQLGMLPGIYTDPDSAADRLETYAQVYLREEIRAEGLVQNLGNFARFLDMAAAVSGQWINYSKLSSDTEISKETIRRYFALLEATLVAFRISPFRPRTKISRRTTQRDRIFLFDIGVRNAILGLHRKAISPDQIGSVFEQWFILQVVYLMHATHKDWRLSSYRTEGGAEVDLVVERDVDIVGIEVKAGRNVHSGDASGLHSLGEVIGHYKPYQKWIAFRGNRPQSFERGVEALPFAEVFQRLLS